VAEAYKAYARHFMESQAGFFFPTAKTFWDARMEFSKLGIFLNIHI
jgi:hypothetical protein